MRFKSRQLLRNMNNNRVAMLFYVKLWSQSKDPRNGEGQGKGVG
jgi:hypothetical protein